MHEIELDMRDFWLISVWEKRNRGIGDGNKHLDNRGRVRSMCPLVLQGLHQGGVHYRNKSLLLRILFFPKYLFHNFEV